MGGLALDNTHAFTMGSLSFGHNGTVIDYPLLGMTDAVADTDSEHLFRHLLGHLDLTSVHVVCGHREQAAMTARRQSHPS